MSSLECRFEKFVNEMDSILKRRQETIKEYDINNTSKFCFFEEISDLYYRREKFHSDILYTIFNPNTKQIGKLSFCKKFIDFLGLDSNEFVSPVVEKEVSTGKINGEKGYIDLLILDKAENPNNAIIIENKINYAPDMKNQLVRYMKYVDDKYKIKNPTIVYLTLTGDKEPPEIKSYSEEYKKYSEKRDKLLKKIKAVGDEKSLVSFLGLCEKSSETLQKEKFELAELARIYISQYRMLLNHLGGKAYMSKYEEEFIKYVYKDKEKMEIFKDIINIWDKIGEIIGEIVESELNAEKNQINDWECFTLKCNENKNILVYYSEYKNEPQIGFVKKDGSKFSPKIRDILLDSIKNIQKIKDPKSDKDNKWIYGHFDVKAKEFNVYKDIIKNIKKLQQASLCTSK